MTRLNDYHFAARFRDTMEEIVSGVIERKRPASRYGTVTEYNAEAGTAMVQLKGDTGEIEVGFAPQHRPRRTGVGVRIEGGPGNKYIGELVDSAPYVPEIGFAPGSVMAFAGSTAPVGWLIMDGATYSTEKYPDLAEVLGAREADNFQVPDARARYLEGNSSNKPLLSTDNKNVVDRSTSHTHVIPQHPGHDHTVVGPNFEMGEPTTSGDRGSGALPTAGVAHLHEITGKTATGGTHDHDGAVQTGGGGNNFPYLVIVWIIKT